MTRCMSWSRSSLSASRSLTSPSLSLCSAAVSASLLLMSSSGSPPPLAAPLSLSCSASLRCCRAMCTCALSFCAFPTQVSQTQEEGRGVHPLLPCIPLKPAVIARGALNQPRLHRLHGLDTSLQRLHLTLSVLQGHVVLHLVQLHGAYEATEVAQLHLEVGRVWVRGGWWPRRGGYGRQLLVQLGDGGVGRLQRIQHLTEGAAHSTRVTVGAGWVRGGGEGGQVKVTALRGGRGEDGGDGGRGKGGGGSLVPRLEAEVVKR